MITYLYDSVLQTGIIFYPLYFLGMIGWLMIFLVFSFIISESLFQNSKSGVTSNAASWKIALARFLRGNQLRKFSNIQKESDDIQEKNIFSNVYDNLSKVSCLQYVEETMSKMAVQADQGNKERFAYLVYLMVLSPNFNRIKTVRVIAGVVPLLGLLGTVAGMIDAFKVISLYGNTNPTLMADGISKALLTTQAGLSVALPLLFLSVFASNRLKKIDTHLKKLLK